ncbi:MAG: winged helix-turn-helix transcriptional regulator [Deltaproteobacteria bacterium]|nr:winged helix-turn-helix transcriptional regulator [Deltaproteobacteria bacterium]MBW1911342.1 winged helix-turn-helix transcriptional regulator [Deltaproteobacteria bacterium]MBW2035085.1 winged helix-turn-helix transcriptional regulator [Deltaproteobacteria bacterium]MBW2115773.1 winged helix-turn-helix transcriptional regulator [Deltaproteobacteria bacterium]
MDTDRLAKVLKALSNPNRLEMYLEIVKKHEASFETGCECLITDIIGSMNIGAPTVSHHLKELANAELIITERRGKFLIARINEDTVDQVNKILTINRKKL